MDIYVGNLSYQATEDDLRQVFEAFGQVASAAIIKDRSTGRSKGFGFVGMPVKAEAESAITGLNGKELKGRMLKVSAARPRPERRQEGRRQGRGYQGGDRHFW